ncbi:hypothetical protein GCK32_016856 [Trichostrongylus colubriformis]|uniref:Uncharacterized protein n=1 Tax=Trichostrongylus colubriformis TaxID=6319 RepID=A0AAN8F2M6_TRICO
MEVANQATTEKIRKMEEKVKGQQAEIARLEEVIKAKEREQMENPELKCLQVTVNASDEKKRDVTFEQVSAMETDDDYFERMVQEVQEDEDMAEKEQADDEDNHGDSVEQPEEILRLCEQALELEQVPYRDSRTGFGNSSVKDGITCVFCNAVSLHYSDSCSQVRRGRDRYRIACQKQVRQGARAAVDHKDADFVQECAGTAREFKEQS